MPNCAKQFVISCNDSTKVRIGKRDRMACMNDRSDKVIVVDDDGELRALLRRFLSEHGF